VLLIEAASSLDDDDEGSAPYVQVVASGDDLHAEVSSNDFLTASARLTEAMTAELLRVGWLPPDHESPNGTRNFSCDVDRSGTDRLAAMAVSAFRDVWSVPHPTFLDAGSANLALGISMDTPRPGSAGTVANADPTSREGIQQLLDMTLTDHLGQEPHKDGDGDIPIRSGSALVFIKVLEDQPLIELKSPLVVDISGRTRAAEVIADLNATWRMAKFVLIRDVVVVLVELMTDPFVPRHLLAALQFISTLADDLDDELATRLGGRLPFVDQAPLTPDGPPETRTPDQDLPPELLSLMHLSRDGGSLAPDEAARICGDDRDLILSLLKVASVQEISWRRSADEARIAGQNSQARQCDDESDAWQHTVDVLRAALRDVVTRRPG
jgi:hypothetical protein